MAVAVDATTTANDGDSGTITQAHTVSGSDRVLYVGTWRHPSNTGLTVAYNGTGLTRIAGPLDIDAGENFEVWRLIAPDTGANNIVVTRTGGSGKTLMCAISVTGADQTTPEDTPVSLSGTGTTATFGTITSATGDLVISFIGEDDSDSGSTWAVTGTGQTLEDQQAYGFAGMASSSQTGAASITDHAYTHGNRAYGGYALNINEAGGGGGSSLIGSPIAGHGGIAGPGGIAGRRGGIAG